MLKIVENEAVKEEGYTLDALARGGGKADADECAGGVAAYVERQRRGT